MDDVAFTHSFEAGVAFLTARGDGSAELWREAITALCTDARFTPQTPLVLDFREADTLPPPERIRPIAAGIGRAFHSNPVAIVAPPGAPFGVARQVSVMAGSRIAAFHTVVDAMAWLSSSAPGA